METRELRYFVAVAEELHFGRAAARLGIAQPPLSRTIARLERRLGVTLLERDSHRVALTPAGTVLLSSAASILADIAKAERRTREAADTTPRLVLAAKAGTSGGLLAKLLDAYAAEPGAADVDLVLCEALQQQRMLRDGTADVALLHRPFDTADGFDTEDLASEGMVAVLPAGHPFAVRDRLSMAEALAIPDLPAARWPSPDGTYPPGEGAEVRNLTQLFQLVALGRTTVVLPESCRHDLRRDCVAVPVPDAPLVTTMIAWTPASRSRAVAGLVRVAVRL